MIHGQLVDLTGEQLGKDLSLCLYPIDAQDSCLLGPPLYSTRSDDSGRAHFHHVKPGSYQLRAFLDKDGNNRLSEGERSPIAWSVAHTDSSNHSLELPLTKLPSDSPAELASIACRFQWHTGPACQPASGQKGDAQAG